MVVDRVDVIIIEAVPRGRGPLAVRDVVPMGGGVSSCVDAQTSQIVDHRLNRFVTLVEFAC